MGFGCVLGAAFAMLLLLVFGALLVNHRLEDIRTHPEPTITKKKIR